jgi:hypothetical protein
MFNAQGNNFSSLAQQIMSSVCMIFHGDALETCVSSCSEKDVDEVLQTTAVFTNVSKGILAKDKELQIAFGSTDQLAICLEVLAKGDLQVRYAASVT